MTKKRRGTALDRFSSQQSISDQAHVSSEFEERPSDRHDPKVPAHKKEQKKEEAKKEKSGTLKTLKQEQDNDEEERES